MFNALVPLVQAGSGEAAKLSSGFFCHVASPCLQVFSGTVPCIKNAIPEATGSVSPENRDDNWYQKTEPENEREHNVQHGKR